ncbi:MAG TPA: helix-turn-helix domain-containing protein [Nitrospiraceae bacterium]|jgi:excisionase family DNA binding protein|nr:helix-turn-helix domain-containing protein [Nitrospiraceae bacterium]
MQTTSLSVSDTPAVVLTLEEACQLLKLKPSRLYYLTSMRLIPFYKVGGSLRFEQGELLRWFERHRHEPGGTRFVS